MIFFKASQKNNPMFKSLWLRLFAYFTALIFLALIFLSMLPIYILEATDFLLDLIPEIMQDAVKNKTLVLTRAIKEYDLVAWRA